MLILFRVAYLYIAVLYGACAALGIPGSLCGLAATALLAVCAEAKFAFKSREGVLDEKEKELRHII